MEAFYVCIIFLGILLVIASLFFIIMDRVNGKEFFKEFDRKKDEMFNLIQESEEMIQELNRMSDYVVTVISEKNQEFLNKSTKINIHETLISTDLDSVQASNEVKNQVDEIPQFVPSASDIKNDIPETTTNVMPEVIPNDTTFENDNSGVQRLVNTQFSYNKDSSVIGESRLVLNSRRREVMKMIEQGLSNDEISNKLKIGKGEIGLIRGLNK